MHHTINSKHLKTANRRQGSWCCKILKQLPLSCSGKIFLEKVLDHIVIRVDIDNSAFEKFHKKSLNNFLTYQPHLLNCPLLQWPKFLCKIPVSASWSGSATKSNQLMLAIHLTPPNRKFHQIRLQFWVILCTDKQTDRQTDKRSEEHPPASAAVTRCVAEMTVTICRPAGGWAVGGRFVKKITARTAIPTCDVLINPMLCQLRQ